MTMTFVKENGPMFLQCLPKFLDITPTKTCPGKFSNGWKLGCDNYSNTCSILDGNFCRVGVN